jgi:hypothetical protein
VFQAFSSSFGVAVVAVVVGRRVVALAVVALAAGMRETRWQLRRDRTIRLSSVEVVLVVRQVRAGVTARIPRGEDRLLSRSAVSLARPHRTVPAVREEDSLW